MNLTAIYNKLNSYKETGLPVWIKNIFSITFTAVLIAILVLLTTTIFAQHLTPANFGYISSYRRLCNLLAALVTGGFIISIPRYISFYHNKSRVSEQVTIFLSFTTSLFIFAIIGLVIWLFQDLITTHLGGSKDSLILILGLACFLLTMIAESTIYAIYQGYQSMFWGNFFYLTSFGIIPLVYAYFTDSNSEAKHILLGLAIVRLIFISPLITFFYVRSIMWIVKNFSEVVAFYKEFLYFSFSRAIGGFGMMGIVSIGPVLALSFTTSTEAGYLEISQNIISLIASLSIGINIGLLTHISKLSSESETEQIRNKLMITEQIALFIGFYLFLQIALFTREIITLWVGAKYLPAIPIIQASLLALIPYSIYTFIRGIVDADNVKPINTIITITAFVVMIVLSFTTIYLGYGIYGIVVSLLAGYFILGVLTIIYAHKTYSITFKEVQIVKIIVINLLIFAFVWLEKILSNNNILAIVLINTLIIVLALFMYFKKPELLKSFSKI